jgi:hypothetical protein
MLRVKPMTAAVKAIQHDAGARQTVKDQKQLHQQGVPRISQT